MFEFQRVGAVSAERRPDRHALPELGALLTEVRSLREDGDAARFAGDACYRWTLHRLWIAAGTEALAYIPLHARNAEGA